jgi:mycothiol system anti-sigma-R factor
MANCNEFYARLILYLDDELDQTKKLAVEEHLKGCQACRQVLEREGWFKEYIARSAPLYKAPENLRTRVASIVSAAPVTPVVHPLIAARQMLFGDDGGLFGGTRRTIMATASVLLVLSGIWVAMVMFVPSQSASFAAVAVDTHQRYGQGRLPLELISNSPEQITKWFNGKTPFTLKLPNYPEEMGQNKLYRLEGARLVVFNNDYAAYVSYIMGERPISLMVASSDVARPTGREQIPSKDLIIHYDTIDDLKVITWSHRGLTYALVSDLEERGQQSCQVCHQDMSLQLGANFDP